MTKVCHMTSAHNSNDVRIFYKECCSLVNGGYDVYLVAQGESREQNGVHIVGIGNAPRHRLERMTFFARKVYREALRLDADIYHIHDPELLPYCLKLKRHGKKVIFDSHEDVPAQIMDKGWIPSPLRKLISETYRQYETYVVKRLDAVVAATLHIAQQFEKRAKKVIAVNNYPRLDDIQFSDKPFSEREPIVCYAGGINRERGEQIMLEAMKNVDGKLILAGDCDKEKLIPGGGNARYLGKIDRDGINALYGSAIIGLCILKPTSNYINSQPIKMYEYMAAGLPFVCSNFPAWQKLVDETGAGVCVPSDDAEAVCCKINSLLTNREAAQTMGRKGREAAVNRFNWKIEEIKMLDLYQSMET